METRDEVVLKRGRARTVVLVGEGEAAFVAKRFHHPGRLQALRDGARARAELRALAILAAAGLPVPRPLGLERAPDGGPEARMEAVRGATPLEALLDGSVGRAVDWPRLAARLGTFLARWTDAPVRHTDVHPGNVLVDAEERPVLIDFHAARPRRRPATEAELRRELVRAAAWSREALSVPTRLRFLAAWRRVLGRRGAPGDLAALETLARAERRALLAHGSNRWLRASSRVSRREDGGAEVLEARWPVRERPTGVPLELAGAPAELRERWRTAGRLAEHGLPVLLPKRLEVGRGDASARFGGLAPSARPLPEDPGEAAAALRALLRDRGLALQEPVELVRLDGGHALRPPRRVDDAGQGTIPSSRALARTVGWARTAR